MLMTKKIIKIVSVIGIIVGLLIAGCLLFRSWQNKNNSDLDVQQVIQRVGELMVLPEGPVTMATVTDKTKLDNQKFFKYAEDGDKVLMFAGALKVILYRPAINKIVEVASILPSDQSVSSSANAKLVEASAQVVEGQMQLALENGTKTTGLTTKFEKSITDKFPNITIKSKEMAANTNYQQTIIVNISGKYAQNINDLADFLEAKVVPLPIGESTPAADALVIFGKSSVQ